MHNLKYLLSGIMLGGAFGAKAGEYLATLLNKANSFAWIESSLVFGCFAGLVVSAVLVSFFRASEKQSKVNGTYYRSQRESTVSSA